MDFRKLNQKAIRKSAHEAAEYVLTDVDLTLLNDTEREILTDIVFRLLVKYFNGRELDLLSEKYVIAEAADTMLERNEEITNERAMQMAVAQMTARFGIFIAKYDKEEKK